MGTPWTDKSAILRDLSFAQGRWVPGGIESAVAGAKPPAHNIEEETEEEYFRRWTTLESGGMGDFSAGPDLFRIKKMLELMQDEETPNEEILSGPIEIRKLNPVAPQVVSNIKQTTKENIDPTPKKARKVRNVAIASIMALANEPLKLIKPEDFIKLTKEDEEMKERRKDSVNKVTNWLQSQDITSMFKKKSVNSIIEKQSLKNVELLSKSPASENSVKSPVKSPNGYTPTVWAEEYYRKAVDRSRMRDLVRDNVWGRAERVMKEIDTKKEELRKIEAAAELEAEIARQCEALQAVRISGDTETANISGDTETVNISGDTETANISGDTETVNISGDTETANISGDTETVNISGDTETVNISGDTETVNISGDTETVNISGDTEKVYISGDTETVNISVDTETVNIYGDTETAGRSPDSVQNAEPEGIGHILLPLSRHELFPAAACVVCRVLCRAPCRGLAAPGENGLSPCNSGSSSGN